MLAYTLPIWLQWFSSFAAVLSSIGVIIAFVQLRASNKNFYKQLQISTDQFKTQLTLTQDQFKLLNQGFVKMTMTQFFMTNEAPNRLIPQSRSPLT